MQYAPADNVTRHFNVDKALAENKYDEPVKSQISENRC
jgi:hypothetical protein